jgi:uncharacterized protein (DUF1778 family)
MEDRTGEIDIDGCCGWVYTGITSIEEGAMNQRIRSSTKETRISVRISPSEKAIIARAAEMQHATLTEFVVGNALQVARQLVAEERQIEMTPDQFKRFCRALDAPPAQNLQAMQKLLREPSILDE